MANDDSPLAYPSLGITLRDYAAVRFAAAMIFSLPSDGERDRIVSIAYRMADALLRARVDL